MNFIADENIDRQIVDRLRQDGHNVRSVAEMDPGISDDEVLNLANEESALLLTADRDFGELIFRQRRITAGVVLIRLAGLSPLKKADIVSSAISKHLSEIPNTFSVIRPGTVRIRRGVE
jgi:predicted nuclease of predicted toxin-antitoxin system